MSKMEEMAERHCDRPRCAQMSRESKPWHRSKAAYIAGWQACLRHDEAEIKALKAKLEKAIKALREIAKYRQYDSPTEEAETAIYALKEIANKG